MPKAPPRKPKKSEVVQTTPSITDRISTNRDHILQVRETVDSLYRTTAESTSSSDVGSSSKHDREGSPQASLDKTNNKSPTNDADNTRSAG